MKYIFKLVPTSMPTSPAFLMTSNILMNMLWRSSSTLSPSGGTFSKLMEMAPGHGVVGVNLKKGKDSQTIGGTVVTIHQFISPQILAYYTVDHDAYCVYMTNYWSSHKKTRKICMSTQSWFGFSLETPVMLTSISLRKLPLPKNNDFLLSSIWWNCLSISKTWRSRKYMENTPQGMNFWEFAPSVPLSQVSLILWRATMGQMTMISLVFTNTETQDTACFS